MSAERAVPVMVRTSCQAGHVALTVKLVARDYRSASIAITGGTDLTTAQARDLAAALVAAADAADARAAKRAASDARRKA